MRDQDKEIGRSELSMDEADCCIIFVDNTEGVEQ